MDTDMYDEFGNYIGPELDSDDEEEEEEEEEANEDDGNDVQQAIMDSEDAESKTSVSVFRS